MRILEREREKKVRERKSEERERDETWGQAPEQGKGKAGRVSRTGKASEKAGIRRDSR